MKQCFALVLSLICSVTTLTAQSISGKVVDEKNNPLSYVSVVLKMARDSSYVGGVATNADGLFSLSAKENTEYVLTVSYVGYKTINETCRAGNIGTIVMKEDATMLEDVSVVASRTHHDANGYTVNLRSTNIVKGKQSSDALSFLPGVTNEDGSYKINGLPVSEIYVDGVKLTSSDELKNLPADMIDKVKVNYLAGSNQNAAMTGGKIEISLRQPPKGGYYGALTGGATYYPSYGDADENVGGVVYYRYKNLNIYDNLSFNFNQQEETAEQTTWNLATDLRSEIEDRTKYNGHTISNRLSLTQQINDRNAIGGSYYIASNRLNTTSSSWEQDAYLIQSMIDGKSSYLDQEATLKYSSALGKGGKTLEIIGDYFNRQSDSESGYSYSNNTSSVSKDESSLNMYKLSVDFTDPRSRKLVWEYGASVQYISSDYTPVLGATGEDNRFQTSLTPTATKGLTPLAYLSAMGQIWELRYNVGVNWQLNRIEYETKDDGMKSSDTQWGINPTVQLMMPIDKKAQHSLMLNYKRKLDDIPYSAISSTIRWDDPYNYTVGNPNLKSPTVDMVMAGASLFRNLFNLTFVYMHAANNIYWETLQSPTASDVFYTTPVNLSSSDMFGAGAEINWSPVKPWTMKMSGRLEIIPEDITLGGIYYGETRLRQHYAMYNTLSFKSGWGGMLNLMLEPTYKTYDRTYHTVYNVGGQIYKDVCKGKLQLALTFNAFGNRRKYDRYANGNKVTYDYTTPVQSIGASLVWRFSGGKSVKVDAVENGSLKFNEVKDVR
jgi:hypothetical protein